MNVGDTVAIAGWTFKFEGTTETRGPNYRAARGNFDMSKDGRIVEKMNPERSVYNAQGMPMTEADIDSGIFGDLYVSLGDPVGDKGAWAVRVYRKPFVTWIWGGCILMALGGFLALSDRRYRTRREAEVPRVAGRATA
jgi:cytochrome c-type biogenesis protein CcmF